MKVLENNQPDDPSSLSEPEDLAKSDDSLLTASHFNRHTPIAPRHRSWNPELYLTDPVSSPNSALPDEESQVVPGFSGWDLK